MKAIFSLDTIKYFRPTQLNSFFVLSGLLLSAVVVLALAGYENVFWYFGVLFFIFVFSFFEYRIGVLLAILLTVAFEQFFALLPLEIGDLQIKIYALDFVVLFSFLSFFVNEVVFKGRRLELGKLGRPILVFGLFSLVAFVFGVIRGGDAAIAFSSFKNYFIYALLYVFIVNLIRSKRDLMLFVKTFLISGVVLVGFLFLGLVLGQGLWSELTPLSTDGMRYFAATHAFYAGIVVIFALSFFVYRYEVFRKVTIAFMMMLIAGIVLSLARHLWISLFVSFALLFVMMGRDARKQLGYYGIRYGVAATLGLTLMVWFLGMFVPTFSLLDFVVGGFDTIVERFESINVFRSVDSSGLWRIFLWQEALSVFITSPFIGIGYGFTLTFDYLGFPTTAEVRSLHNTFLAILLQMGVAGFISFVYLLVKPLILSLRKMKYVDGVYRPIFIGSFVSIIYFLINAQFGIYFEINLLVIFFWILVAMLEMSWRLSLHEQYMCEISKTHLE